MSSTQLTTFADLYTDLGQRLRLQTTVSATLEQLKRYINISLQDIHLGFDYKLPWCERTFYLRTKAPYTTGTLTANQGSATLTGSGTAWNTNNAHAEKNVVSHGKFLISGYNEIYKVNTVTSDTSIALYTNFIGTSASGLTYTYFEDEYSLSSSFLRPVDLQSFSPQMGISLIPRNQFRRLYPVVNISGKPKVACIVDTVTSGSILTPVRKVIFYPYPDQAYIIPYTYITANIAVSSAGSGLTSMSADDDQPTMPLRYRHAIVYHALYHWYRDKKDDMRSEAAKAEYNDIMLRIVGDDDIATHNQAQLRPMMGSYRSAAMAPYSRRGGRRIYDLNDQFDSFRR